jgi:hypothetical protein
MHAPSAGGADRERGSLELFKKPVKAKLALKKK